MRRTTLTLAALATVGSMLLAGCSSDGPGLTVPDMPGKPSAAASTTAGSPDAPSSTTTGTAAGPAVTGPETDPANAAGVTAGVLPNQGGGPGLLTGETPTDLGVEPAADGPTVPDQTVNPEQQAALEQTVGAGNSQARKAVGPFTADQSQAASDSFRAVITAVRTPDVTIAAGAVQVKAVATAALTPGLTPTQLTSTVNQSIAVAKTPVAKRTIAQQSWLALIPAGLCAQGPFPAPCVHGDQLTWTDPVVTATTINGEPAVKLTGSTFYIAELLYQEGSRGVYKPVHIGVDYTTALTLASDGTWRVAALTAQNVRFQEETR